MKIQSITAMLLAVAMLIALVGCTTAPQADDAEPVTTTTESASATAGENGGSTVGSDAQATDASTTGTIVGSAQNTTGNVTGSTTAGSATNSAAGSVASSTAGSIQSTTGSVAGSTTAGSATNSAAGSVASTTTGSSQSATGNVAGSTTTGSATKSTADSATTTTKKGDTTGTTKTTTANTAVTTKGTSATVGVSNKPLMLMVEKYPGEGRLYKDAGGGASNYSLKIVANVELKLLRFYTLNADTLKPEKLLYTTFNLNKGDSQYLITYVNDTMPTRCVACTDTRGVTRYFAICYSGKDGSIYLDEIKANP